MGPQSLKIMKRTAIRIEDIASWHNLARAVERAARGKRYRPEVGAFVAHLDRNLAVLRTQILDGTVPVGLSTRFHIRDPKPRVIHAPCFRERVLHHALMAYVGPVLDRTLVDDTFACRTGRGTLAAVHRCQHHIRRFPWYAKLDVRQYFASIDHDILKCQLRRRLKSAPLLSLLDRIIDAHHERPGKGLPIGALTSQVFANFYLNPLDRFLLESCRVAALVRYMDDFVFFGGSRQRVGEVMRQTRDFLRLELKLTVKDTLQINQSARGLPICGYRIFPGTIRLARSRRRRYIQAKRHWEWPYRAGRISARKLQAGFDAALAITAHADAAAWRRRQALVFSAAMWYEDVQREQVGAGAKRVMRGGSWNNSAQNVRAAYRNANEPGNRNDNLGFRCLSSQGRWMTPSEQTGFLSARCVGWQKENGRRCASSASQVQPRTLTGWPRCHIGWF